MAGAILEYRLAVKLLARAVGFADAGAPFGVIAPRSLLTPEAHA
jgi:hypothetical protein